MSGRAGRLSGTGACAIVLLSLALAAPGDARAAKAAKPRTTMGLAGGFGSFTPASADPRLAAVFARSGLGTDNFTGGAFRFTPSGSNKRRAVTVAVRARAVSRAQAAKTLAVATEVAPSAFSLGMSVGWKRFAISGDVARLDGGVRYKAQREQFQSQLDDRRDSQAVYLGTTFRF